MLCQECHNVPAAVHVKKRQGDEEISIHLCRSCAKKMGWNNPLEDVKFPLAQFISSMMHDMSMGSAHEAAQDTGASCSECGVSFEEFSRTGRLGCGHCYEVFRASMQELLRRIHGNTHHEGRRPARAPEVPREAECKSTSVRQLKADLDRAIANEDFEAAAALRDRIRAMNEAKNDKQAAKQKKEAAR